jgi:hypothetical protein
MLAKEQKSIEKICEIPVTLADISESIFEGISTKNIFMHRLLLPEEDDSGSFYLCEDLCKPVFSEPEIVYPYISGSFTEKFAVRSATYRFLLPYELSDKVKTKKDRIISPDELKFRFPLAYSRFMEFKKQFRHDTSPLKSSDYSIIGRQLMDYLYTPKIIAIGAYHLQAAYDTIGNHVFRNGCGIVLKDPSKYSYITAVLNSPIATLFPAMCKAEGIFSDYTVPAVLGRFPIRFPDNWMTEYLISTISSYLMFLYQQIYKADYEVPYLLKELTQFYEQISNLLILDTYLIIDLDPEFINILEENIHSYAGDIESENDDSLLNTLCYIKERILETSRFGKFRFKRGLADILSFSQSSV